MNNTYLIENLSNLQTLSSDVYFIGEKDGKTYKLDIDSLSKEFLKHMTLTVGRTDAKGSNVLSVYHETYDGQLEYITNATIQDGILSSVHYDDETNNLILYFNATDPDNNRIKCNLSGLVDTYTASKNGVHLCSDYNAGTGNDHKFCLNYNEIKSGMNLYSNKWIFEIKQSDGTTKTKTFNVMLTD